MRARWPALAVLFAAACSFDTSGSPGAEPSAPDADPDRPDADPNAPDADPNAPDAELPDAAVPLGPFGSPTRIDALSSAGSVDDDPSVTGDLLELYFDSDRVSGLSEVGDVFVSTRPDPGAAWGAPSLVPELSSSARDTTPKISADGLTIWFSSTRPGGLGGAEIYVSTRATRSSAWSTPTRVTELNSSSDDFVGAPTPDGLAIVVASDRGAGSDSDLYIATRPSAAASWGTPVEIGGVNTSGTQSDGYVSSDRLQLWYMAIGSGQDIFLATRPSADQPFGAATVVGELSTGFSDRDAFLSPDLSYVVFATTRDGNWEIYEASR